MRNLRENIFHGDGLRQGPHAKIQQTQTLPLFRGDHGTQSTWAAEDHGCPNRHGFQRGPRLCKNQVVFPQPHLGFGPFLV